MAVSTSRSRAVANSRLLRWGDCDQLLGQRNVVFGEPNILESTFELLEMLCVVIAHVLVGGRHPTLPEILERGLVDELHVLPLLHRCISKKIVENVKSLLARGSTCDALAFKIAVEVLDATQSSTLSELELGVFTETRAI